jgi:hypothetical protein
MPEKLISLAFLWQFGFVSLVPLGPSSFLNRLGAEGRINIK